VERNRTNVTCVRKHLDSLQICTVTWESTREINHTSVHCVTKVSAHPATCSYINVKYTASEHCISVLTVGSCLRQAVIWSFMFVFTLVQSRTLVNTVQSFLHTVTNSRHICWSHTMKVLGWRVTFVRWNSLPFGNLSSIYFDLKVWSLIYAVSVQSVSLEYVNWILISWYTRITKDIAVVCVVKILDTNITLYDTLRDVQLSCNLHIAVYDWLCCEATLFTAVIRVLVKFRNLDLFVLKFRCL